MTTVSGESYSKSKGYTDAFGCGAGFSNIFPHPAYQKAAVQNYLTKYPPPYQDYQTTNNKYTGANGGVYNSIGRGDPDLSAVGQDVLIYINGDAALIGGTSASAPLIASMFTRINEVRLKAGKSTVGFVNPTLYKHPEIFKDVVSGSSFARAFCSSKGSPQRQVGTSDRAGSPKLPSAAETVLVRMHQIAGASVPRLAMIWNYEALPVSEFQTIRWSCTHR